MKNSLILFFAVLYSSFYQAQSTLTIGQTTLQVDTIASGLDIPWEIVWGPDNYIWMTERRGRISRVNPNNGEVTVILNHQNQVWQSSESGMLGMALHPDFPSTPHVFVAYTYGTSSSNAKEKLVRFEYNGTNLVNETTLLDNIPANSTHIGARILFLPDGTILMTTGDAQNQPSAQSMSALSGKVLRINQDGTVPSDNPFGSDSYVYASGLRNTQGMFQLSNGRIFIAEHGPNTDDEFMELLAGRNYGWPNVHGFCDTQTEIQFCDENNVVEPLIAWTPTIAPSDLIFYENPMFPEWNNKFLMTVLKDKMLIAIEMDNEFNTIVEQTQYLTNLYGRLRDICIGPNKEIYLATNGPFWSNSQPNTHTIVRLTPPFSDVNLEKNDFNNFTVFPNPTGNQISFYGLESAQIKSIFIRDYAGRLISQIQNFDNETIDVSVLQQGIYLIEIIGNDFSAVKSFVKN